MLTRKIIIINNFPGTDSTCYMQVHRVHGRSRTQSPASLRTLMDTGARCPDAPARGPTTPCLPTWVPHSVPPASSPAPAPLRVVDPCPSQGLPQLLTTVAVAQTPSLAASPANADPTNFPWAGTGPPPQGWPPPWAAFQRPHHRPGPVLPGMGWGDFRAPRWGCTPIPSPTPRPTRGCSRTPTSRRTCLP